MPDVILYSSNTSGAILTQSTQGVPGTLASPTGTGVVLVSGGAIVGAAGTVNLASSTYVSGTLGITNGGTGQTSVGTSGQVLTSTGGAAMAWASASSIAIIQLTGDVLAGPGAGSLPATVVRVNGATIPAAGALVTGNSPYVSGTSALTYSALNLAGGSGWVTGALPVTNLAQGTAAQLLVTNAGATAPAWVSASQDVSLTAAGAFTVTGLQAKALPALTAGVLQYSGSAWALSTVATTGIAPGTSAQILMSNATPATTWTTMSGDATISATGVALVASAQNGTFAFGSSGQIALAGTAGAAPGIFQNTTASATPATFTITPQASSAGATANGSSVKVALSAAGASATDGTFSVGYGSGTLLQIQNGTGVSGFGSAYGILWLLGNGGTPSISNYTLYETTGTTVINGNGALFLQASATNACCINGSNNSVGFAGSWNVNINSLSGSYGGGIGVLGMANANTQPTSTPSGGIVLSSQAGNLTIWDTSSGAMTIGGGTITNNFAMSIFPATGPGYAMSLTAGTNNVTSGTGGTCTVGGGAATGTTSAGGALNLTSGHGTSTNGVVNLQLGGSTVLQLSGTVASPALLAPTSVTAGLTLGFASGSPAAGALLTIAGQYTSASSGVGGGVSIVTGQGTGTSGTAGVLSIDTASGSTTPGAWKWTGPAAATTGSSYTGGFAVPALVKGFPVTINSVACKILVCLA